MPGAQIDIIKPTGNGGLSAAGGVAKVLLANNFNANALRTNDVLRKEEWKLFDTQVVNVARQRLVGVSALVNRGLTFPIANALGTTQVEWEQASDMTPAEVNMSGVTEGERDRIEYDQVSMPVPIIHKDFKINIRALEASRRLGQPLDTTHAALASRVVSEGIENLLFSGSNVTVGGTNVAGLTTYTSRLTGSVTASWALGTTTGAQMLGDVLTMIAALQAQHMYGPYGLFCSIAAGNNMANDYKAESDKTIADRLLEVPGLEFIIPTSNLTGSNVVMFQLTSDVIDIIDGMQPTMIQWDTIGGMVMNFKVMAIMVPRIRSTVESQCGLAHYS